MIIYGNNAKYPRHVSVPEDLYANELADDHVVVSKDERGIYRIGRMKINPCYEPDVGFGKDIYEAFSNFCRSAIYSGLHYRFLYGNLKALLEKEKAA